MTLTTILSNAYILSGSPCSGKSTMAEMLAGEFDFPYYKVDDHELAHMKRSHPERHPTMTEFSQRDWNEIWSRPVDIQVAEELAFYRERFEI